MASDLGVAARLCSPRHPALYLLHWRESRVRSWKRTFQGPRYLDGKKVTFQKSGGTVVLYPKRLWFIIIYHNLSWFIIIFRTNIAILHLLRLHFHSSKIYVAHIPIDLFPSFEVNITSHKFAQESTQRKQLFCAGRSRRGLQSSKCTWVHSGNGRRLWHSCRRERQANWNHWKAGLSGFETEIFSFFASFSDVSVTSARALLSWPSLPLDGPHAWCGRHHAVWRAEAALGCGSLLSAKTQATCLLETEPISPSPVKILSTPLATMLDVGNLWEFPHWENLGGV